MPGLSNMIWSSSSCEMFDRLLKIIWVLNMLGFWIWHNCIWEGYTESWICLNITQYASICLNFPRYAWMCLNIGLNLALYWWMPLNISENAWINCSDYVTVLNMPHHTRYLTGFWICIRHYIWWGSEYAAI